VTTDVGKSEAIGWAGRLGLAAKGVPYVLIAYLALKVAFGERSSTADRTGALRSVSDSTTGRAVLITLAAGFIGYALWRFAQGALNRDDDGWPKRLGSFAKGLLYLGFAYSTIRILTAPGTTTNERKETANAFDLPLGRYVVFAVGAGFAGAAVWNAYRGLSRKFMDDMRTSKDWIEWLGLAGHLARGVVWGIVAWFLIKAAYEYDSNQAVGLDGALAKLLQREYGEWVMGTVAAGLAAYGLFCFAQGRYRDV
jgi:hypothetical protein